MLRESRRRIRAATTPAPPPQGQRTQNGSRPAESRWRVLPFDYAATIKLSGVPGSLAQGVITVGPDAAFVATGIGYGLEEDLTRPIESKFIIPVGPTPPANFIPRDLTLGQLPIRALIDGFRLNPRARALVFAEGPDGRAAEDPEQLVFLTDPYDWPRRGEIFQQLQPNEDIAFLLSIIDSATGRELQDEPVHNIAALGSPDGRRPFRPLAKPMAFLPRSTIRLQVVERLSDRTGWLDVVLFGFKVPAGAGASEETVRQVLASEPPLAEQFSGSRVIPFDYVAQLPLKGVARTEREVEIPINVEGTFVATGISYALDTTNQLRVPINVAATTSKTFPLSAVTLEQLPIDALLDGMRLRPAYARLAFDGAGNVHNAVRIEVANELFERVSRPETVAFRYRLHDAGAGRDLQNQFILGVAGLGIANGQRPFKRFTRPLTFEPRSTLRVSIKEISGRGMLHIVLQGFKRLARGIAQ